MTQHNDFFTPQHIDDQIEQLQQVSQDTRDTLWHDGKASDVVHRLQQVYGQEANNEAQSLMRVRHRVMQSHQALQQKRETRILSMRTRDTRNTETHLDDYNDYRNSQRRTFGQRFGTFAAVVLVCLLGGSAAVVFYTAQHGSSGHNTIIGSGPTHATPTVAPSNNTTIAPSGNIGKTITTYQQDSGIYTLT